VHRSEIFRLCRLRVKTGLTPGQSYVRFHQLRTYRCNSPGPKWAMSFRPIRPPGATQPGAGPSAIFFALLRSQPAA
jgi:hypothetical protein